MVYSESVKKAIHIMMEAHRDDVDKGGYPYILHPLHIAEQFEDEDAVIVALLHDVVEDHGDKYTFEGLQSIIGFNDSVLEALKTITKNPNTPYVEYIDSIGKNSLATRVKLKDLWHNMDSTRVGRPEDTPFDELTEKEQKRYTKYIDAYSKLLDLAWDNLWIIRGTRY